jgi:threonine aldolase
MPLFQRLNRARTISACVRAIACQYGAGLEAVNLYSDTQTRPTPGMRRAMAEAEVGDEQRFQDPTVNRLQDRVAELLGHAAGLFLPTGTMCNLIGFRLHLGQAGDEVLLDRTSHPLNFEAGSPGAISHAVVAPLDGERGVFTPEQVEAAVRPPDHRYMPRTRLVSVEQTTNMGGGRVWPLETVRGVLEVARAHGLRTHLDGARLMNAVVASGTSAAEWASRFDTAWIDFSKGLGAPVGAVLCGSRELIDEAWRWKQMLGGAMRQAGVLAAACLYALDHHVERLADDHENARVLADGLTELGLAVWPAETNILIVEGEGLAERAAATAVEHQPLAADRIRLVTHLDVDRAGIEAALDQFRAALG